MDDNSASFSSASDDVFGRIASRYDQLCDLFSLGIHRLWKTRMAHAIAAERGRDVLDVGSGTGDIPSRLLRVLGNDAHGWRLQVSDISPQMLAIARTKVSSAGGNVEFKHLDACNLALQSNSVDIVSIAFGLKIMDRRRVLAEVRRVLKPGGVLLSLEASRIVVPGLHAIYLAYMDLCMPLIGRLAIGGDASAYQYLLRGVHEFPDQQALAVELADLGFEAVSFENLSLGIVALHRAVKPLATAP